MKLCEFTVDGTTRRCESPAKWETGDGVLACGRHARGRDHTWVRLPSPKAMRQALSRASSHPTSCT